MELLKQRMRDHGLYALALSEIRRDGAGSIDVGDGFTFVFNGAGPTRGVGILLGPEASRAWRAGGSRTRAPDGGRLLVCSLKLAGSEGYWHLFSIYGPTLQAAEEDKANFFSMVQEAYDAYPLSEVVCILGDWNCRVGSRADEEPDLWRILGRFGVGPRNSAGEALLNFCAQNRLRLMNTFFDHPVNARASWWHPRFKTPGLIDFAVLRQKDAKFVLDVKALPGADIDSDHNLMRIKLRARPDPEWRPPAGSSASAASTGQRPKPLQVRQLQKEATAKAFLEAAEKRLLEATPSAGSRETPGDKEAMENLVALTQALRGAGEEVLEEREPDRRGWREGNTEELKRLAAERRKAYEAHKSSPSSGEAKARFKNAAKESKRAVRKMINTWWNSRMDALEAANNKGDLHDMFGEIKDLNKFLQGGPKAAPLISSVEEQLDKMTKHFEAVLNVEREHKGSSLLDATAAIEGLAVDWSPPTVQEVRTAVLALRKGKSPDLSGVHAEMLQAAVASPADEPSAVLTVLHAALARLWETGAPAPPNWLDAILVPLYKQKGDIGDLDNWRGVVLLDIISKAMAILLNTRLRAVGEQFWSESQSGFRPGRGTSDAVFVLRRIFEEYRHTVPAGARDSREGGELFVLFVDLRKAFDSVDRGLLWSLLEQKLSVPPNIIAALRRLHDGMGAQVLFKGKLGRRFSMRTGVRQGAIEGPTLWNIFFHFVLDDWRRRCREKF